MFVAPFGMLVSPSGRRSFALRGNGRTSPLHRPARVRHRRDVHVLGQMARQARRASPPHPQNDEADRSTRAEWVALALMAVLAVGLPASAMPTQSRALFVQPCLNSVYGAARREASASDNLCIMSSVALAVIVVVLFGASRQKSKARKVRPCTVYVAGKHRQFRRAPTFQRLSLRGESEGHLAQHGIMDALFGEKLHRHAVATIMCTAVIVASWAWLRALSASQTGADVLRRHVACHEHAACRYERGHAANAARHRAVRHRRLPCSGPPARGPRSATRSARMQGRVGPPLAPALLRCAQAASEKDERERQHCPKAPTSPARSCSRSSRGGVFVSGRQPLDERLPHHALGPVLHRGSVLHALARTPRSAPAATRCRSWRTNPRCSSWP